MNFLLQHKALQCTDTMYHTLKEKLNLAQTTTDLIPFINILINIGNLKNLLSNLLDKEFKNEKKKTISKSNMNDKNKIRSLFLSIFILNGIPSDVVHAKIISYLPSKEYRKLPIISKTFRNIMKNNPFIYIEKGYHVKAMLSKHNSFNLKSNTLISINHFQQQILIKTTSHKKKPKHKTPTLDLNMNNLVVK